MSHITDKWTWGSSSGGADLSQILETVDGNTLTWDGVTDGVYNFSAMAGTTHYHISDTVLSKNDFTNGATLEMSDGTIVDISLDNVTELAEGFLSIGDTMELLVVPSDNNSDAGITIDKKGIYAFYGSDNDHIHITRLTINGYTGFTKTQLKEEYIPQSILDRLKALEG